jgi:hypothetical protein
MNQAADHEDLSGIEVRRGTDKSLAFLLSYFPILQHNQNKFFLGWVKEVRTTKS